VVPFEPLSEDPSSLVLARGLTEDVISDLARADEVAVLAGDATAVYREPNPRQVASDLGASYVVAGTISGDGDRIRISAALHDVRGRVLWTDRWDRPARDFFAIQTEIAETMANQIGGGAGRVEEAGRLAARRKPPKSLDAYELYLLGTEPLKHLSEPELERLLSFLQRAIQADPGLARAVGRDRTPPPEPGQPRRGSSA
jgi:TolB-like protein